MRNGIRFSVTFAVVVLAPMLSRPVLADMISFQLSPDTLTTTSSGTVVFEGTVTNDSGGPFSAADLSFSFFGYDPASVTPTQILGFTNFLIPNNSTSVLTGLFSVSIDNVPTGSSFPVEAILVDPAFDLSAPETAHVDVAGTSAIPEPAARGLLSLLAAGLLSIRRLRRRGLATIAALTLSGAALQLNAQSLPGVVLVTQTPVTGVVGSQLICILGLVNAGATPATNVEITSVTLGTHAVANQSLPLALGTIAPSGLSALDLRFNSSALTNGASYLLTVRGTYVPGSSSQSSPLGFTVNRFVSIGPASTTLATEATNWAAFDAVRDKANSLPGIDVDADLQVLLAFVRTLPQFVQSGIVPGTQSLWAQLADGEQIIVASDFTSFGLPAPVARRDTEAGVESGRFVAASRFVEQNPRATTGGTGLPASPTAHFFDGLGAGDHESTISRLSNWAQVQNYSASGPIQASVGALKRVGGEGVLYVATHAGFGNNDTYALWTTTPASLAAEVLGSTCSGQGPQMGCEVLPSDVFGTPPTLVRRLLHGTGPTQNQDFHYSITAEFVRQYWKNFSNRSLVYIDACNSNNASKSGQAFVTAVSAKNASVYAGWSLKVGDAYSAAVAELMFDRLLGVNLDQFEPEDPKQRAFDYNSALQDLSKHGLGSDPDPANAGTMLVMKPSNATSGLFQLLAPSIGNMTMDELTSQLTINGIFGDTQGSVQVGGNIDSTSGIEVVSGGAQPGIVSWNNSKIVVQLPLSGTGSAGNVQVSVANHVSNVAQLTEWQNVPFTFTLTSDGTLQQHQSFNVHMRADIRRWRKAIHDPPSEPMGPFASVDDSTGKYVSSGSARGIGEGFLWSGSGSFVNFSGPSVKDNFFLLNGEVIDSRHGQFAFDSLAIHGLICTTCPDRAPCTTQLLEVTVPFFWLNLPGPSFLPTDFMFDDQGTFLGPAQPFMNAVAAGVLCNRSNSGVASFNWTSTSPTAGTAPNPQSAR